jgi:decaprenyl-phosphate phosphoribosyltransferase
MHKLKAFMQLARPHQYVKNGFIFLPVLFGHRLTDPTALAPAWWAFVAFCLAASGIYAVNDLRDLNEDRNHPTKKSRPLAAGLMSRSEAGCGAGMLFALSLAVALMFLDPLFLSVLGAYLLLNLTYSYGLKHVALIDVFCIALGFVLRIFAGGQAAGIWPSHWLVLMTFLLALFLALAKRRDDLLLLAEGKNVRQNLNKYNLEFTSLSMVILAAVTIVSYILYTVSPEVSAKHATHNLYLTSFWVILGLLRYMQLTFVYQETSSPTMLLFKDIFLQITVISWLSSIYLIIYVFGR